MKVKVFVVSLILIAAFSLQAQVVQQVTDAGSINWQDQIIRATGIGAPNPKMPLAAQRAGALLGQRKRAGRGSWGRGPLRPLGPGKPRGTPGGGCHERGQRPEVFPPQGRQGRHHGRRQARDPVGGPRDLLPLPDPDRQHSARAPDPRPGRGARRAPDPDPPRHHVAE